METAIEHLLSEAKAAKLELEILAQQSQSTTISFQKRKMEQFSFSETAQIGIRVLDGRHEGMAFSESLTPEALTEMLSDARANARMIEKQWPSELGSSQSIQPMPELFNPALAATPVEQKIQLAELLEGAALDTDNAILSVAYTRFADQSASVWVANSRGVHHHYRQNSCYGYTYCLAADGDNRVMGGETAAGRDLAQIDARQIGRTAAERALRRRGATRPQTGRYTVVFENRAAERLWGLMKEYFSAKAVDEERSPLGGKVGQTVFSPHLTLLDDPFAIRAHGARPFDDEGYPSQRTTLVNNGRLDSLLSNSVLARKLKIAHTANASRTPSTDLDVSVSNLIVAPGPHSLAQLVGAHDQVILVTDLTGTSGFRATSGDFSLPAEGHLYKNGQWHAPLKDFVLAGNVLQLLQNVEGVGADALAPVSDVISPSLLVPNVNVAGQN